MRIGKIYLAFMLILLSLCFSATWTQAASDLENAAPSLGAGAVEDDRRPVLVVKPREIDLGYVKPGESVFAEFSLKNLIRQNIAWSASCPEDWEALGAKTLKGIVSDEPGSLNLELSIAERTDIPDAYRTRANNFRVTIKMESAGREFACYKDFKAGTYRKAIKISSTGGQRTVHLGFHIRALQELPSVNLNPKRLDLGVQLPGKIISRRIELTNRGRETLRWKVNAKKHRHAAEMPSGQYVSFRNEKILERGTYVVPDHLKDSLETIGRWAEKQGYPVMKEDAGALSFKFSGTGISLYMQSYTEDGNCQLYLDEKPITLMDDLSGEWEKKEIIVAENLSDGPHTVSVVVRSGTMELEGVKVFGKAVKRGPVGWISVFPNSGTTGSETDYINIKVDTSNIEPGSYGDEIVFRTNAGEESAEIYVDIAADATSKIIDVYLYSHDYDCLFTSDPQAEARRLIQNGYIKEGIAFRLFVPGTPGTTSFYRWYNPSLQDHFYHYDRAGGGKKLNGYVYEGIIGNIATSRMTNTHELYRWYNSSTKKYYYSTNPKAPKGIRKGYKFDGIAGYVR